MTPHRLTVTFTDAAYAELTALATERGTTKVATIRSAIALERMARQAVAAGGRVLLEAADGTMREILIR